MSKIDWRAKLGWDDVEIEELRHAGFAYIRQGKYDIAKSFFEALVVLDSEEAYNFQTLGAIYLELNEGESAIKYLDRALQLEGDHSPTLLNLCKAFFQLSRIEEGLKLAEILKDDPSPEINSVAKALILAWS